MPSNIVGINRTSLWRAWKAIRRDLRNSSIRDVVDYIDFDIDPDVWINRLLRRIATGGYEPGQPTRFTLGKAHGLSRTMTFPRIADLTLYRAIVDHIYRAAKRSQHKNVYFLRDRLSKATAKAAAGGASMVAAANQPYASPSRRSFLNWLRYEQYRKHLLYRRVYRFFVLTDITNFFDSVLHSHVAETLRALTVPPRMIGLLFFLLERLALRGDYTDSPRIGLPVDEFDCSRTLAHLVLFSHDDRMVNLVGENGYVRWMDDQQMGVSSRAEGLRVLAAVGRSLGQLHLTPNARKSVVLSLSQTRRHFHLDLNQNLDKIEKLPHKSARERTAFRKALRLAWVKAKRSEGDGHWDKILKRFYRLAGLSQARLLRFRALRDSLSDPQLAGRIIDYVRWSGTQQECMKFSRQLLFHDEQVYPDVSLAVVEGLLRLESSGKTASEVRLLASDLLRGKLTFTGSTECAAIAPLLVLRFGDRRSLPLLRRSLDKGYDKLPHETMRAVAVTLCSYGDSEVRLLRRTASRITHNYLAEVVWLVEHIQAFKDVPGRYKARLQTSFDAVGGRKYLDMRVIVAARLLTMNKTTKVRNWAKVWKKQVLKQHLTRFDKRLIDRLLVI